MLKPLLVIAERWGLNWRAMGFRILSASAFHAQDELAQAMAALDRALCLAEPAR